MKHALVFLSRGSLDKLIEGPRHSGASQLVDPIKQSSVHIEGGAFIKLQAKNSAELVSKIIFVS